MRYLAIVILCVAASAKADPWIEAGPTMTVYDSPDLETARGHIVRAGMGRPYLWASTNSGDLHILGQRLGAVDTEGIGLGMRYEVADGLELFGEFGYYQADSAVEGRPGGGQGETVEAEVVHQKLWNDHATGDKTPQFEHTRYELDNGYGGALGVAYTQELAEGLSFSVSAERRSLSIGQKVEGWNGTDEPTENCGSPRACWWINVDERKFNGWRYGMMLRYAF